MALINKINVADTTYDIGGSLLYGVCETAKATVAKTVTVNGNFTLETGATVAVKFTNTNSASSPTLNVNGTGAKAIKRYGTTAAGTAAYSSWQAGQVVIFVYDGTQWQRTFNETYNGDITGVTAGSGLTGGGSSGSVTLNVGAGTGIAVADDAVSVKLQDETALSSSSVLVGDFGSTNIRPIQVDADGNLAVKVNDGCYPGGGAPIVLSGRLWSSTDNTITSDIQLYSDIWVGSMGDKGRLINNAQIHPDAREFCQIKPTWTLSGTTLTGTATLKGLSSYYEGLTLAVILTSDFQYADSIYLNINSLGNKAISGISSDVTAVNNPIIMITYYGTKWHLLTGKSTDHKVKQYNIDVSEDLANGVVHWNQNFPLLFGYNRDSSEYIGETAYSAQNYYLNPLTDGLVAQRIKTNNLDAQEASTTYKGLMSKEDKIKLDNISTSFAPLDDDNKIPTSYLPSYVDDVLEYSAKSSFPTTGESGKIYVDTSTNKTYRWSGSAYVEISASLAIGTTASTAAKGNHTHSASYTPAGSVTGSFSGTAASHTHTLSGSFTSGVNSGTAVTASSTSHTHSVPELKFTGTAAGHTHGLSGSFTSGANSGTAVTASTSSHTHNVTAAGTVGANTSGVSVPHMGHTHSIPELKFTGTAASHTHSFGATTSGGPSATVKVGSETHTHSIPALTFTGSSATSGTPSATTAAASLTSSVSNQRLTLTFSAQTVATGAHTHSVTATGSVGASTTGAPSATTSVGSSAHTHTTAAATTGSASHTPSGTISVGTGTSVGNTGIPGATDFAEVATKDHTHSFTGSAVTSGAASTTSGHTASVAPSGHTHSTTLSGNTGSTSVTPAGSISSGTGTSVGTTGSASTLTGHTVTAAPSGHTHSTTLSGNTGSTSVTPAGSVTASFSGTAATITTGTPK